MGGGRLSSGRCPQLWGALCPRMTEAMCIAHRWHLNCPRCAPSYSQFYPQPQSFTLARTPCFLDTACAMLQSSMPIVWERHMQAESLAELSLWRLTYSRSLDEVGSTTRTGLDISGMSRLILSEISYNLKMHCSHCARRGACLFGGRTLCMPASEVSAFPAMQRVWVACNHGQMAAVLMSVCYSQLPLVAGQRFRRPPQTPPPPPPRVRTLCTPQIHLACSDLVRHGGRARCICKCRG